MQENAHAFGQPVDLDTLAAQHTPTGPPPDDEESALIDIGLAFQNMGDLTEDGSGLVHVERGGNLGGCAKEINRRFGRMIEDARSSTRIEKVKFLNRSEAVVWFTNVLPTREGRAVLVDGEWKVSRATYCSLVAMGGVTCPPPPEREV